MRSLAVLLAFSSVFAATAPSEAALQEQPRENQVPMPEEARTPFVASCLAAPAMQPVPKFIAEHTCGCIADSFPKYVPREDWDSFRIAAARQHAARERGESVPPLGESRLVLRCARSYTCAAMKRCR